MIDIAGEMAKDYKINFMAYRTGVYKIVITFKNESSGEYLFYRLNVQVSDADIIDRIELSGPIRETSSKVVTIENPTENEITILRNQFIFTNEFIDVTPDTLKIPPKSEGGFEIIYRPLNLSE